MDDADRADDKIESAIADGIEECRRAVSIKPCGHCHYCDEPVPQHHLFCSSECSSDFEKARNAKIRSGVK